MLVTHGIQWLPKVDNIIVLLNGSISECGTYEELLSHDGAFAEFLKTYFLSDDDDEDDDNNGGEVAEVKREILQRLESVVEEEGGKPLIDIVEQKRSVSLRFR